MLEKEGVIQLRPGDAFGVGGASLPGGRLSSYGGKDNTFTGVAFADTDVGAGYSLVLKTSGVSGAPLGILVTVYYH